MWLAPSVRIILNQILNINFKSNFKAKPPLQSELMMFSFRSGFALKIKLKIKV